MPTSQPFFFYVLSSMEIFAVIAFAVSGITAALRAGMDFVGICFVAGVAAFGGGTIRDLLLDRRPFFWVEQDALLWMVVLICLGCSFFIRKSHVEVTEKWIQIPDAIGLGLFAALGTQVALIEGAPVAVALLMGVISSTFGGVLRDTFCNVVPKVFADHQPYVILALLGSVIVVCFDSLNVTAWIGLLFAVSITTVGRLVVLSFNISIPSWRT